MNVSECRAVDLAALVPLPAADANKYTRGTLVAVVGSERYPGAACLSAAASQRAGAGYTEVVTHPAAVELVRMWRPSLVVRPRSALPEVLESAGRGKPFAFLVGCGFDASDEESEPLVHAVLERFRGPVVVDGSGLDALVSDGGRGLLRRRFEEGDPTVVTPHSGEAARLARPLGLPADDPCSLARSLALALGVVALVKGPVTYASDGDKIVRMAHGTSALAKAGTGDVLAGMVGALLAQGAGALDAAVLGAELHARAGRVAAARLTDVAVIAEDVVEAVPLAIAELLREAHEDGAERSRR
ncbi:NAD(P)H-hydrate dehydratase [Gordonibacter sp. An230]|nr:NAD(P)H-hydrate dehydratase [Gordonibacter sp. An230]